MRMSRFPNGFSSGLIVRNAPIRDYFSRKILWVGNNATTIEGEETKANAIDRGSFLRPYATLAYALTQALPSDEICVRAGHTETVSTAGGLANGNIGVRVIGCGDGANRPVITFSATDATWTMNKASCSVENIVVVPSIDSVVSPIVVSAANCYIDIESQDASSTVEFVSVVLTTASADKLRINLKHIGFIAGDAGVNAIRLVGVNSTQIYIDYYGKASTAVVEMITTACDNVFVRGQIYNASATGTKNVVDTQGSSVWDADIFDMAGGYKQAGGSGLALASIPTATDLLALPRSIASSAKTLTTGNINMFTISGGPIKILELVGIVTTIVQAQATSVKVTVTTTSPAATVDFSAAAVDLTGAAAGASIRHINTTGILTVVTAGFVMEGNAFATNDTQYLVPAGTMQVNNASASNTGAITWYLRYVPLSPNSRVA